MRDLKMMPLGDQVTEYVGMIHVSLNYCDIGVRKENDDLSLPYIERIFRLRATSPHNQQVTQILTAFPRHSSAIGMTDKSATAGRVLPAYNSRKEKS